MVAFVALAALVVVGVVAVTASANSRRANAAATTACSLSKIAGTWGRSSNGWDNVGVLQPWSAVGRMVIGTNGNVTGTETGGWFGLNTTSTLTVTGTLAVNTDCTGTLTLNVTASNTPVHTETWSVVFVSSESSMLGAMTAFTIGSSQNVSNESGSLNASKI